MKRLLRLSLIGFVLVGFFPLAPGQVAATSIQECAICGHVCCCPDICAKKIKELNGCKSAMSSCRVGSSRLPVGFINQNEQAASFHSSVAIIRPLKDLLASEFLLLSEKSDLIFSNPTLDICTPPPKFLS